MPESKIEMEKSEPGDPQKGRRRWLILAAVWVLVVAAGICRLAVYQLDQGSVAIPPAQWPDESRINRRADRAALVMVIHPYCPCSRASLNELSVIMQRARGEVIAYLLFYRPKDYPEGWEHTDLWRDAAAMPDVNLISDEDGSEARRFDARTSGQCMLYDGQGQLRFSGGLTLSRGHTGANPGVDAIVALLGQGRSDRSQTPVFGCPIVNSNKRCGEKE
jgi:hypothetical protein